MYTGRVSGNGRKGFAAIEQLGFGNDLGLVSYHFSKSEIFRAMFHAAHCHRLLRTACSEHFIFNKAPYEGTKSSGRTAICSVTCLTWNRKVHYRAHNSLSPVSTAGKVNCLVYYFIQVWCTNYHWFLYYLLTPCLPGGFLT